MTDKAVGFILLIAIILFFIIHPYYYSLGRMVYDIAKYSIIIFGIFAGIKLIR